MRMQEMVEVLERRGFDTTKHYDGRKKHYIFTITKDSKSLSGIFTYPEDVTYEELDDIQRNFLDKLIVNWSFGNGVTRNVALETGIKKVIFNPPATIVLWEDGTKTVVKAQNEDEFDSEKGLAMAISKKALGNKGNYCNEIKKWTEPYEAELFNFHKLVQAVERFNARFRDWRKKTDLELAYDALLSIKYPQTTKPEMKKCIDKAIFHIGKALDTCGTGRIIQDGNPCVDD